MMCGWVLLDNPMIIVGMYQITYAALLNFTFLPCVMCIVVVRFGSMGF